MNTFKRKALFTAVLAGLGAFGAAEAAYLTPLNTGQVLVYPYYTVQSDPGNRFGSYICAVASEQRMKTIKVLVREVQNSQDMSLADSYTNVVTARTVSSKFESFGGLPVIDVTVLAGGMR